MFIADKTFPLVRHVVSPQNTRTLTLLGWTDDTKILNATLYQDHVQKNTAEFMTVHLNIGHLWLGAMTILPPRHIHDLDSIGVHDADNFSTFRISTLSVQGTTHLELLNRMNRDLRHTHRR